MRQRPEIERQMRATIVLRAAVVLIALHGLRANAQDLSGADRAKVTFDEVEHGVYAGAEVGLLFVEAPGLGKGLGSGAVVGLNLGWDFSPYFGLGLFAIATSVSAPSGYQGLGDPSAPGGDFTGFLPGVEARLHLPIGKDQNEVSRLFFNVGLGVGLMFLQPRGLFPTEGNAPSGKLDVSLEYYTHVRHLSVGLALEGLAALPSGGQILGGDLSPFIRYSF